MITKKLKYNNCIEKTPTYIKNYLKFCPTAKIKNICDNEITQPQM